MMWPRAVRGYVMLRILLDIVRRLFRVVRLGKLTRFAAFLRDKFETQAP